MDDGTLAKISEPISNSEETKLDEDKEEIMYYIQKGIKIVSIFYIPITIICCFLNMNVFKSLLGIYVMVIIFFLLEKINFFEKLRFRSTDSAKQIRLGIVIFVFLIPFYIVGFLWNQLYLEKEDLKESISALIGSF